MGVTGEFFEFSSETSGVEFRSDHCSDDAGTSAFV
jgi:hypothetical protein